MRRLFRRLSQKEWLALALALVLIVAQVFLDLRLPEYMAQMTRILQTPGSRMADIWATGGLMMLCALGSFATAVVVGYLAARTAASFSKRIRRDLYESVSEFSQAEMERFSTASLITRSTNDIAHVQMFLTMGLQLLIKSPIMAGWAIIKIAGKGDEWTIATGIGVLAVIALMATVMLLVIPRFKMMQTLIDNINKLTRESLTGLRVTRAYNAENYQQARFEAANAKLTGTQLFTNRVMGLLNPLINGLVGALTIAIYWIGASLINAANLFNRLTIFANMVVFSSYAMSIIMSFLMMAMVFVFWPRASVAAKRINEVLETKPSIKGGTVTEGLSDHRGDVSFKNVSFTYPGASAPVVSDLTFDVKGGETLALIGSTGSGKSTVLKLLLRFFDPTEGQVSLEGVDVRDYTLEALYRRVGYVPQKAVMFHGTVSSNLAMGMAENDLLKEDAERALAVASAKDFVDQLEGGLSAEIEQGATNLSGGQKQRLAMARAVARKPDIFLFDDSFSALDYQTDRDVRMALKKETAGATKIIVAQRIGTIKDADQIIVMDEGRIVGKGKHRELLKTCAVYQQIALSQLSEEELSA